LMTFDGTCEREGVQRSPPGNRLTKPAVTAVELQATTEPHCSQGVQPGDICEHVVHRDPPTGAPGPGLAAPGPQAPPIYAYASCRSGSFHKPTAFEVVPITTYNTVRGFGVSDQELFTNKAIMFMAVLLLHYFCLPPPRPGPAGNTATTSLLLPCTDKQQAH
jgi:hypothetical protein